jgi:CheY-like chemotaxis protein
VVPGGVEVRVLVVDDGKLARLSIIGALRRLQPDCAWVEAPTADKALEILASEPLDVVLIDFNMPGMDGLKLAAAIRQLRPDMPVAVVSANIQTEVISGARALNAAFVQKPVTDEALGAFLSGASLRLRRSRTDEFTGWLQKHKRNRNRQAQGGCADDRHDKRKVLI